MTEGLTDEPVPEQPQPVPTTEKDEEVSERELKGIANIFSNIYNSKCGSNITVGDVLINGRRNTIYNLAKECKGMRDNEVYDYITAKIDSRLTSSSGCDTEEPKEVDSLDFEVSIEVAAV